MSKYANRLKIAKALKAKSSKELIIKTSDQKEISALHNDLNDLATLLKNVLTDKTFQQNVDDKLVELNNSVVELVRALGEGLMVKNQPVLDEVTVKNLKDIIIPDELTVKNPTELPKDLATNKNIKEFQNKLVASFHDLQKAVKENKPTQAPEDFIPYRRVIKVGKGLVFDDASIKQIRYPAPWPTFQDSSGNVTPVTLNPNGSLPVGLVVESVEIGKVDQGAAGSTSWKVVEDNSATVATNTSTTATAAGAPADAAYVSGSGSIIAILKAIFAKVAGTLTISGNVTEANSAAIKADVDKIPSQGQALAAGSTPVVLTAAQQTALTPPSNTGYALDSSLSTIDTDLKSNITLHAGTNTIGNVVEVPATSGGLSAASGTIGATATSIKGSAGQVYGWYFYNNNSAVSYVQFFDLATGSVTVGTTAPKYSLGIPPNSGANVALPQGIAHGTAITIAITTTRSGLTAPTNTVDYNVYYA